MNERDEKLVDWLGEAHAKEAELEADLAQHIGLTKKDSYEKRLRQHLTETRAHKRKVAARIKKLGGKPGAGPNVPGSGAHGEVAGKTVAALKGQVGTARAVLTSQVETHVRNAHEELREEHVEIALYNRIEVLANEVGDAETAKLAKEIRREEERMAKFLEAEMPRLVKELVRAQIPREQRASAGRSRSPSRHGKRSGSSNQSAGGGRSTRSVSSSGSSAAPSAGARAGATASSAGRRARTAKGSASRRDQNRELHARLDRLERLLGSGKSDEDELVVDTVTETTTVDEGDGTVTETTTVSETREQDGG
jgi:ferritin-like metal-binding protein YciE